jgi:hypothetical protein
MGYHADRFKDFSLLFYADNGKLVGLLPASINEDTVISHGGLTYGGIVSGIDMRTSAMLEIFDTMLQYLQMQGVKKFIYKAIPYVFHKIPAQEDLYALQRHGASLCRRDASSVLFLPNRPKISENKRRCIAKATRQGLAVRESTDFVSFFEIGERVLGSRHQLKPVHTSAEMELLARKCPDNIKLYASFHSEKMLAGVLVFVFPSAVHLQYMFNDDDGLDVGALDIIIDTLINNVYPHYAYMSFGVSTEQGGTHLNEGLIRQKEMFGARTVVNDFYEMTL